MLILYEENEVKFESLGLGVLKDALSAIVKESLNDSFELEIEYPITGALYDELKVNRIITSKSSPYSDPQPFRITSISKPISGIVEISLVHISYDMNGIIVGPINGSDLKNTLQSLESGSILEQNFKFFAEKQVLKSFTTNNYYNMRSLLFGSNESILETYKQEIKFDKFNVYLMPMRGSNRGAEIRYGKNMTDLTHEISYENLYNGVYPYYHKETTSSNVTATNDSFTEVYIVEGATPLRDGWLSYTNGGEPYHPINESPVKINSQGDYYGKVYTWDTTKQKYIERLVDQTVTIVEGVTAPEWIYIDWSKLPSITVKANKPGYFKMINDTEYVYHDIDDIVWQGSIRSVLSNLVMYYSEVIPQAASYNEETESDVTHIDMTDKILYLETDTAKKMKFNRILPLDLTSEFKDDEEPNDETLKEKALKYIRENKLGEYKYNTKVSFIDLSSTTEGVEYKGFDKIELGDMVKISYEALDVDLELRVISVEYDALLDVYSNIELGEKSDNISSSSVQTGDNISSLSNDKDYQTQQQVVKIVADTVTAEYIQAKNASFSKAQIEELQTARIKCTGIIEATQFELDHLVAKFLVADGAEIKGMLKSGEIEVAGDITVKSGEISIQNEDGSKTFSVDRDGNLYANSATIEGNITASSGNIGGFTIGTNAIYNNLPDMESDNENGVYVGIDGISLGKQLKIYPDGTITSLVNNPSVDPESPEAKFLSKSSKKVSYSSQSTTVSGPSYNFIGSLNASAVQSIDNYAESDVINIISVNNIPSSLQDLKLSVGDNIVALTDPDGGNLYWSKLDPLMFDYCYKYKGEFKISVINDNVTNGVYKNGDIVKILEKDETLEHYSGLSSTVNVGDYFVMIVDDTTDPTTYTWNKFYYASSSDSFFGLTPDGILYANGAVISGDITVKSGEISIENETGEKVFRVTRDGDLTANSGIIAALHVYNDSLKYYPECHEYDENKTYVAGDYCYHKLSRDEYSRQFRCRATTTGKWNHAKWDEVILSVFSIYTNGSQPEIKFGPPPTEDDLSSGYYFFEVSHSKIDNILSGIHNGKLYYNNPGMLSGSESYQLIFTSNGKYNGPNRPNVDGIAMIYEYDSVGIVPGVHKRNYLGFIPFESIPNIPYLDQRSDQVDLLPNGHTIRSYRKGAQLPFTKPYDPTHIYNKYDYCIYNDEYGDPVYWECNADNVTGAWNENYWSQSVVGSVETGYSNPIIGYVRGVTLTNTTAKTINTGLSGIIYAAISARSYPGNLGSSINSYMVTPYISYDITSTKGVITYGAQVHGSTSFGTVWSMVVDIIYIGYK